MSPNNSSRQKGFLQNYIALNSEISKEHRVIVLYLMSNQQIRILCRLMDPEI